MTVLRVDGLAKRWDATSGLAPVSFAVSAGELLVVRGRSGTGKSTLLSILAGWCDQDRGTLERTGPWAEGGAWRRWDRTAAVPQVLALLPELSVLENVTVAARVVERDERSARQRAAEMLDALDLAGVARRSPAETSVGQQQRAAVARAVVAQPTLLLVDEPTSHQDAGHAETVAAALHRCVEAGTAAIVVTHDPRLTPDSGRVIDLSPFDPTL